MKCSSPQTVTVKMVKSCEQLKYFVHEISSFSSFLLTEIISFSENQYMASYIVECILHDTLWGQTMKQRIGRKWQNNEIFGTNEWRVVHNFPTIRLASSSVC